MGKIAEGNIKKMSTQRQNLTTPMQYLPLLNIFDLRDSILIPCVEDTDLEVLSYALANKMAYVK